MGVDVMVLQERWCLENKQRAEKKRGMLRRFRQACQASACPLLSYVYICIYVN